MSSGDFTKMKELLNKSNYKKTDSSSNSANNLRLVNYTQNIKGKNDKTEDEKKATLLSKYRRSFSIPGGQNGKSKIVKLERKTSIAMDIDDKNTLPDIPPEKFQQIYNSILDVNMQKVSYLIHNGCPVDIREYSIKKSDPFVIFLNDNINLINSDPSGYYTQHDKDVNLIMELRMPVAELVKKDVNIKLSIFKILLQKIRFAILGNDSDAKDITKREIDSPINSLGI